MRSLTRMLMIAMIAISGSFARADVEFNGVDLNPALLGCIMGDFDCLTNTGVGVIDNFFKAFFGNADNLSYYESDEYICYCYMNNCYGFDSHSDMRECRNAKKNFYKSIKQKLGEWNPPTGTNPNSGNKNWGWTENDYFEILEEELNKHSKGNAPYFNCTRNQLYIWRKHRCGHTEAYKKWGIRQCLPEHAKLGVPCDEPLPIPERKF